MVTTYYVASVVAMAICLQTAMPPAQIQISAATVILAIFDNGMWKFCFYNC
jgi:hypothetical protein